jgi:dTMP kinase
MADTPHTSPTRRGAFIVLEGIDGAGTTTQAHALREHFRRTNRRAFFTHEPSDGPVGMLIRLALQGRLVGAAYDTHEEDDPAAAAGDASFDPTALALLFAADRADHLATQVKPNLDAGRIVVCDRYLLSTLAYQGQTSDDAWLLQINRPAIVPDLTLFLDLPPAEALERMRGSRWKKDLFETDEQQRSIRARYLALIERRFPQCGHVEVVDSSRPAAEVTDDLVERVEAFLATRPVPGE